MNDEPVRLAEILSTLDLPPRDPLGRFLASWMGWIDEEGFSLALPGRWQIRVLALVALGLTGDDLDWCVHEAMTKSHRLRPDALFTYAITVGWGLASERLHVSTSPLPPSRVGVARRRARGEGVRGPAFEPDPGAFLRLGPMVRLARSGKVHLSTCRTLARANPAWVVPAPSIPPFTPCQTCLGGSRRAPAPPGSNGPGARPPG